MSCTINPIIPGFAPDPSIVRVDDWYFIVNSSSHLFPGLPIYASQDLATWQHIGNAINRAGQLGLFKSSTRLSPPGASTGGKVLPGTAGLYAPTIRHHNGTFYIVCTNALVNKSKPSNDKQNFIISAKDIWANEWSDPVYFDFEGIDPDIFFGHDGKVYITGSATPGPWTRMNCFEVNINTGERLSEERTLWTGTGGVYPEGPHLHKRNEWYYLLIAEGGTHVTHSITMARSRSIWGPYEPCPSNPLLSAAGTDNYIQHTGHGDLVQDKEGQWWAVCLAVRKDEHGRYAMSRETFLTLVEWQGEWPVFKRVKSTPSKLPSDIPASSLSSSPSVDLVHIRNAVLENYHASRDGQDFNLTTSPIDLSHPEASPTLIGKRQRLLQGQSSVTVTDISEDWASAQLKCGLAYYKDEHRYCRIFFDASARSIVCEEKNEAQKILNNWELPLDKVPAIISFSIKYTEQEFHFIYSLSSESDLSWNKLAVIDTLDMTDPDFVGPVLGIFAIANEGVHVQFKNFDHC
ncbi:glycosyl hydrolase [Fusarium oxysporum]|nr:glycosyl hydrolase [Fusarium oxysporum]